MTKNNKEIKVTDPDKILELREFFQEEEEKNSKKLFISVAEERSRTVKVMIRKKIKSDFTKTRKIMFENMINDIHPNLSYEDMEEGCYYRTGGKSGNVMVKLDMFNEEEMSLLWFNKDQKFIKSVRITGNNKISKIRFIVFVKGLQRVELFFEKRVTQVYQQRERIAFKISILKAKMELLDYSDDKKNRINKKIQRMIQYSKKLF